MKHYFMAFLFVTILGITFFDFDIFLDSELKSKWYWCYIMVSISGFLFFFFRSETTLKINSSGYLIILLFFYCFIRAATGHFLISYITFCLLIFLMYYLFVKINQGKTFTNISGSITIIALSMALYGIIQYADICSSENQFKVNGGFDNPAGYASMLTFSAPFIIYFTLSNNRWIKYGAWIIYMMTVAGVILSASRSGILTILILTILYIVRYHKSVFTNLNSTKKNILIILIITVILGLYFTKKDSANGRILIWKCTWEMIKDMPLFGHGYKSFKAEYMLYQANYFAENPESKFILLSDNIRHPFNEFLLLIAEFGFIAFLLLVLLVIRFILAYRKLQTDKSFILMLALSAITIFSCFSYPFQYPFTWFVLVFSASSLSIQSVQNNHKDRTYWISKILILLSSLTLLIFALKEIYYEKRWYNAVNQNALEKTREVVLEYETLYPHFKLNAHFLYNYAAKANYLGDYNKSMELVIECERFLNGYDIQMLKADNCKKQQNLIEAKFFFTSASHMCPSHFLPLHELVYIYDSINQPDMALRLAHEIINKPVKIPSGVISAIKMRMKQRVKN